MASVADIEVLPNGARFYRADLHIHSYGGSYDVQDATMTPARIVQTAVAEGLDVIAVSDHNEIASVEATLKAAVTSALLGIPAVELSTSEGHLLCFLPTLGALQQFFGRITIVDRGKQNSRCQNSVLDCLNHLEDLSGFGILAHVDGPSGFESQNPGNSPHKVDVLCHKSLLGIELRAATSVVAYSDIDPDPDRANAGKERIKRLRLGSRQNLARILGSDSHTLGALGRNAEGNRKLTRVKMDRPSFHALRIALEDNDARVRVEDLVPTSVPYVVGVHLEGGFLDGQHIHFSRNLNCIIGGRGTGKSTMFEAVRCLAGHTGDNALVDSEAWPTQLTLFWQDQAGQLHTLARPLGGTVTNVDDPIKGPTGFAIESYGQGETAKISKEAQGDPLVLLSYLDRFVDIEGPTIEEGAARDELLAIQTEIEKATKNVDLVPQYERSLATTQQQLAALEKAKAKDVIDLQRKLATERELRSQVSAKLIQIQQGLGAISMRAFVDDIAGLADPTTLAVGAEEFKKIVEAARSFEAETAAVQSGASASFEKLKKSAEVQISTWKAKETQTLNVIDERRKALEAQNIRLDVAYIQKLAKDEAKLKSDLTTLRTWKPRLDKLRSERTSASKKRWAARERIATIRDAYGREASATLRSALSDVSVSLKFLRSACSPDAEQQVVEAMGWRTVQVPRAALLVRQLTLPGLLEAIDRRDLATVQRVTTDQGARIFDNDEALTIVDRLSVPAIRFALERCEVYDFPRLTVTKAVTETGGKTRYLSKDFSKLSLGQQQSVLLALMLSSKSNAPLIIDQPEDNLDGEFIYHSLVPVLRMAKERRQIIVVTHNANIAVLGDAEQIVVLKSTSDKGLIMSRGSIDDLATREAACNILEGAWEAFQRRSRIYGAGRT